MQHMILNKKSQRFPARPYVKTEQKTPVTFTNMRQYRKEIHQQSFRCKKIIYFSKNALFKYFFFQNGVVTCAVKCFLSKMITSLCWSENFLKMKAHFETAFFRFENESTFFTNMQKKPTVSMPLA